MISYLNYRKIDIDRVKNLNKEADKSLTIYLYFIYLD